MRALFVILIHILAFAKLSSQATVPSPDKLLFKTHAERAPLLIPFYHTTVHVNDSVSTFNMIAAVRELAEKKKDAELLLETELMRAHYFYYRRNTFSRQQILNILDSLHEKGIQNNKIWLQAMAGNMLALYNFQTGYYEDGFIHHQRVYELIKDLSPSVFPHKQNCLKQMADEHYLFRNYREVIFYSKEAIKAKPDQQMTDNRPPGITLLNNIGLAFQKMNDLDSSDHYFQQAIDEAKKNNDQTWVNIAGGNLGTNYFLRGEYQKAIPLLEKDVAGALEIQDWGLASGSQMILGNISLKRGETNKAWEQLQLARKFVYLSEQFNRKRTLYPLLSKLYAFKGMGELAALYLDSAMLVKDSLDRSFNTLLLVRAKQKGEIEQYKAEMEHVRSTRRINLMERNILMAIVVTLMGISIWVYSAQKKKAGRAREELTDASKRLAIFAKNIADKNALIETLQEQKADAASTVLHELQKSTILTDEEWDYFRSLFEKAHPGFLHRLKEKVPGLTPAETRFLVLTRLELSGKEMAAMLGIGNDAIRQMRSRVRKKLALGDETSIEELARSI